MRGGADALVEALERPSRGGASSASSSAAAAAAVDDDAGDLDGAPEAVRRRLFDACAARCLDAAAPAVPDRPLRDAFASESEAPGASGPGAPEVPETPIESAAAEAPAVDVRAGGAVLFGNLANPDEAAGEVPPATYSVDIAAAGAADAVFGPIDLVVAEGVETTVYAVGSLGDDFGVLAFTNDVDSRDTGRLAGDNRILTAIEISERSFPTGSDVVYLARSDVFADAVAGGSLTDGPILLVPSCGDLPEAVGDEIGRLGPDEVIALGGAAAICDSMLAQAGAAS